ncbi:hypothetical protein HK104_009018 [Borealophlyctis nickersoniae]|nr:hypothetical protein HK104_009018 [Borealophlyctis nickersoniae]
MSTVPAMPSMDQLVEFSAHGGELDTFERAQEIHGRVLSHNGRFTDAHGRTLLLRGVNISGTSKIPTSPPGSTHLGEGFYNHTVVSFVGRPFPLDEVDEHFERLRAWGLTFVRFLVTWEALEHEGPGIYDEEFIDYLIQVLEKAPKYGIKCFIDPHQDTWSRFSGGSGAPGWTFEVAGMDLTKFMETGAAYVHQKAMPEDSGHTAWPTNYQKLASATMFTLFFGGDIFAPHATYRGEPIQQFLQRHFCACFRHLAERLKDLEAIVGFEVMNEPHTGYIGMASVYQFDPLKDLHFGDYPSALQSMALGSGCLGKELALADPEKLQKDFESKWSVGLAPWKGVHMVRALYVTGLERCIACILIYNRKQHGVWDVDSNGNPRALKPDYFSKHPAQNRKISFYKDCYVPFINRYREAILSINRDMLIFFEPIPNEDPPLLSAEDDHASLVYAPHWYDLKALFTKSFGFVTHDVQGLSRGTKNVLSATYFGIAGANENYKGQIRNLARMGLNNVGKKPCVIGECGIPMDMNEKKAFETGDYRDHTNFLDAVINAMEASLLNFTLWNYNPHNDNMWGDHWNGEDFSIYSPSSPSSRHPSRPSSRLGLPDDELSGEKEGEDRTRDLKPPASSGLSLTIPSVDRQSHNGSVPSTPFDITEAVINEDHEGHHQHYHHIGGRALDAVVRPYAAKIAGEPTMMRFNLSELTFNLQFTSRPLSSDHRRTETTKSGWDSPAHVTEIFVPNFHYGKMPRLEVRVSDGEWKYDRARQTLYWRIDLEYKGESTSVDGVQHSIYIGPPPGGSESRGVIKYSSWWLDRGIDLLRGCHIL